MKFLSVLLVAVVFGVVVSCAHKDIAKSSPTLGQTKSEVVETFGSPDRAWRKNSQDHWFYDVQNPNSGSVKKILVFENNRLLTITTPTTQNELQELEAELLKLKNATPPGKFESLSD